MTNSSRKLQSPQDTTIATSETGGNLGPGSDTHKYSNVTGYGFI